MNENKGYRVVCNYVHDDGVEKLLLSWPALEQAPYATREQAMDCWDLQRSPASTARSIAAGTIRIAVVAESDFRAKLAGEQQMAVSR